MKKIISMLLMVTMLVGMIPVFGVTSSAATVLTISRPSDWQHISKNSPPTLKWSKISGAAGYTVTVKNDVTGKYYTQNEWTTSTSYSLADLFDEKLGSSEYPRLKIWVGAMKSTDISQGLISTDTQDSVIVVVAEKPDISVSTPTNITSDGATLKVTVNKNYGSDILDAGFYIGTSSTRSSATKYSLSEYGPSQVSNSGTMTMKITGLEPDTKYYCWGYAENYVDETVSSSYKTFWTEEDEDSPGPKFNQKPTLTLSIDGNKIGGDIYGTYVPNDEIYLKITANYSDHVFVETSSTQLTFTNPKGTVVSNGTFVEKTSSSTYTPKSYTNGSVFQVTVKVPEGIPAGDYTISVTATDGVYDGNNGSIAGTSYYTAEEKSVTVRIGKKASDGSGNDGNITTLAQAKSIVMYSTNTQKVSAKKGYIRHMPQITGYANFYSGYWVNDSFDLTTPYNENNVKLYKSDGKTEKPYCHELCSRAVYSMALSYIGIDVTPVEMSTMVASRGISGSYGNSNPYNAVTEKLSNVKHTEGSLDDLYNNYMNDDNYSPVYFHFSKPHCVLIIGQKSENVYYVVDPSVRSNSNAGMANEHVYEMTLDKINKKVKSFSYNGKEIFTSWGEYEYSYVHQWYIDDGAPPHTHTYNYTDYETEHPHKKYWVCYCGEKGSYTGETKKISGCTQCYPTTQECDHNYVEVGRVGNNVTYECTKCNVSVTKVETQSGVTVYSVIYDANGGNNAPDPSNGVKSGTTITLSTTKPTRSGYTFLGWALDKNATSASYQPGDSYTVTGATTLYAVWDKQSPGGGSSGGESNQTYIISGEITSHTSGGNYTIILYDADGEEYSVMVSRTPDYEFEVTPGRYTLEVSKAKHITYRCDIVINSTDVTQNVTLCVFGDCDGDGEITVDDAIYIAFYTFYPDRYPLPSGMNVDFDKDGVITVDDAIYLAFYTFYPDRYPLN